MDWALLQPDRQTVAATAAHPHHPPEDTHTHTTTTKNKHASPQRARTQAPHPTTIETNPNHY